MKRTLSGGARTRKWGLRSITSVFWGVRRRMVEPMRRSAKRIRFAAAYDFLRTVESQTPGGFGDIHRTTKNAKKALDTPTDIW